MSRQFNRLVESQIQKARAEGKLDNLEGQGEPLPDHPEDRLVDPGLAIGMRIMAESGALPEEITIKKQITKTRTEYQAAKTEDERKRIMAKLARLDLDLGIATEARKKFFGN